MQRVAQVFARRVFVGFHAPAWISSYVQHGLNGGSGKLVVGDVFIFPRVGLGDKRLHHTDEWLDVLWEATKHRGLTESLDLLVTAAGPTFRFGPALTDRSDDASAFPAKTNLLSNSQ